MSDEPSPNVPKAMTPPQQQCWVLWHKEYDGSGADIHRVYLDYDRAEEDFSLVDCGSNSGKWMLEECFIYGPSELPRDGTT